MRSLRNEYLILLSVIVGMILIGLVLFFILSSLVRQEAAQRPTPAVESEENLQTRIAQVFEHTPTVLPDPVTIIHEIRSLARLETIQYTLEKVIRVEEGQNELGFLFGDKLLFVGHGRVIAGLDLAKMRPEDMWVDGGALYVRLPQAEVFVSALDNEKSYVYNRDTGLLTKGNIDLERTARAAAEKEIVKAAVEDGILNQAQQNAESYMSRMLRGLGYPEVIFVNDGTPMPATAGTPPADTTQVPTLPALTQPAP
jgi:hypothetical protein